MKLPGGFGTAQDVGSGFLEEGRSLLPGELRRDYSSQVGLYQPWLLGSLVAKKILPGFGTTQDLGGIFLEGGRTLLPGDVRRDYSRQYALGLRRAVSGLSLKPSVPSGSWNRRRSDGLCFSELMS
jgi:hypothetical protein